MTTDFSQIAKQLKIDDIEVIENGVSQNVMRPDVMNFLMLASIASQAVRMRKYFDDRTSEGYIQNWALVITPVVQEVVVTPLAQTLFIVNDGPAPIFIEINKRFKTPIQLLITESTFIDFETHKLKRFYVYCAAGLAATARAAAKR